MLSILLTAALLFLSVEAALPPSPVSLVANTVEVQVRTESDCSGTDSQAIFVLVRSCLITLAVCFYQGIHPNIPDANASIFGRLWVHIKIVVFILIAPEAVICWAIRQYFGGREIANAINSIIPELHWSSMHGQFAQMGGFGRRDDERILYPATLIKLLQEGRLDPNQLRVPRGEIWDKGKQNILSKGFTALQISWFVLQFLAGWQNKLPISQLEVVTFSFIPFNYVITAFWWWKPFNALFPICVDVGPEPSLASTATPSAVDSSPSNSPVQDVVTQSSDADHLEEWKQLIGSPFATVIVPLLELGGNNEPNEKAKHVQTFYAERFRSGSQQYSIWTASCFLVMAMGAIPFLSWRSTFPTHTQEVLWRTAAVVSFVYPLVLLLSRIFVPKYMHTRIRPVTWRQKQGMRVIHFIYNILLIGLIAIILARFCLFVLAFLALHSLPPRTFDNVLWVSYIPHL
ncbi:hypothetical protein BDN72DRAFT_461762 [Pluteus cervinus]|uniref:Uncharacterized protein n=1 Tax=Pluteus cervinus TaxID=181527 RepID=A0ACD3A7K2_9AGAR|nr:hypothetical protein BDN72DRAFT_461762 [Pluteus cervinus]